jgi:hypothetical protein
MRVHTKCERKLISRSTNRLAVTEERSMMMPMGILNKQIGKYVKKYIRLNSIVEN